MAQTQFGRFDKYDGMVGGFRAPLAANMSATGDDIGKVQAVSISNTGKVVIGAPVAETQVIGVICPVKVMFAGDPIDVMTSGEIVGCVTTAGAAFTAGAIVTVATGVSTGAVASAAGKAIGRMIELDRMVVRCPVATT